MCQNYEYGCECSDCEDQDDDWSDEMSSPYSFEDESDNDFTPSEADWYFLAEDGPP